MGPNRPTGKDVTDRQCDCAERTGELVVFTCPVCCTRAVEALKGLTNKGLLISLDREGSVSALVEGEELYG